MVQLLQVGIFAYNISNLLLHFFGQAMLQGIIGTGTNGLR